MRPHVHRLAGELGLSGWVGNDVTGVLCQVEGSPDALAAFARAVEAQAPPLAVVEDVTVTAVPPTGEPGFRIVESTPAGFDEDAPVALVPPDTATCSDCLREMSDPADRRYRYPFVACTFCGPRFTIVAGVPYDRPFTTMARFALCPSCQSEYDDPTDRRFHAQPTACPLCGPRLSLRYADETGSAHGSSLESDAALAAAIVALRTGGIVAVKGVGGYHLACDAHDAEAVALLRARKQRSHKPFALLAANLGVARRLVRIDAAAEWALRSPAGPIVLAEARLDDPAARAVRDATAPGQSSLGIMVPSTGLHHLLTTAHPDLAEPPLDLLVLTSANLSDEPICTDPAEAEQRLAGIADAWLHHDRPIHLACDDSVVRLLATRPSPQTAGAADAAGPVDAAGAEQALQPVRRSRGYAPVPVRLPMGAPALLAVGGELKATVCLARGRRAWLSQHLGDVASLETLALLERTVDVLAAQSRVTPQVVVADLHPGYLSRRWAVDHAAATGATLLGVQHHHAHVASLLAEHARPLDKPVLGVAFDGTGYGHDGTIWGGEMLLGGYREVRRVAHLRPIPLPGGDAAVRHPSRVALAHLHAAGLAWDERLPAVAVHPERERTLLSQMLRSGAGCVPTTSMGRLFDAVSALAGVCHEAGYEGQAAIELEALLTEFAVDAHSSRHNPAGRPAGTRRGERAAFALHEEDGVVVLDPSPVLAATVDDVVAGASAAAVSHDFHRAVARAVRDIAREVRGHEGVTTVGLTGGVFQNATMTTQCRRLLEADGFEVLVHRRVPPNDAGLALGQAAVAAAGGGR